MREYGQIQSAFWTSDLRTCSDGAKLLACYLMTGPHTNGVGCFLLPNGYIQEDHPGWSIEQIEERFEELSINGFAYRFERVCYIPKFLSWNTIANGNIARARFLDWVAIPRGLMRQCAAVSMLTLSGQWREADKQALFEEKSLLNSDFGNGSLNGLRNGLANLFLKLKNQHPTPPHPITPLREINLSLDRKLNKKRKSARSDPELSSEFMAFWQLYPRKEQRAKAAESFAKIDASMHLELMNGLTAWIASHKWLTEPQFIPHPTTWLNGKRWRDQIPPPPGRINGNTSPSKTRQGIETLMRGVNGHESPNSLARSPDTARTEQALLLEPGKNPSR